MRRGAGCTKAEGGGGLRLRIRGVISGIYCLLALWDEKQRDLVALPCNFFLLFFLILMWLRSSAFPSHAGSRREPQPLC